MSYCDGCAKLVAENKTLREEIASLHLEASRRFDTFEGRTAEEWSRYARTAEKENLTLQSGISAAIAHLSGDRCR
jgi:hypothetical protein